MVKSFKYRERMQKVFMGKVNMFIEVHDKRIRRLHLKVKQSQITK